MKYQILKPEAVRVGVNSLAGLIVEEAELRAAGHDPKELVSSGAIEAVKESAPKPAPKLTGDP